MEYNKLVASNTVYVDSNWVLVDTHGLLCKMSFMDEGNTLVTQLIGDDGEVTGGEYVIYPGETIEFIGKMRIMHFTGSGGCNVRFLLYDKG